MGLVAEPIVIEALVDLIQMRTEVQAHGFTSPFDATRIDRYLNDANRKVARRADYYTDEATLDFSTVAGTVTYPQPADFAKDRSLRFVGTTFVGELQSVGLRTIDRAVTTSGIPTCYAIDGANLHLYPTPDTGYTLELRYWRVPALLVADTDSPPIADDYCDMLIYFAISRCYWAEDDAQMGPAWEQKYNTRFAEFAADVKFPNSDQASQVADFWQGPPVAGSRSWTRAYDW